MPLYLISIAWMYVATMMAVAEATSTQGTILGAVFTFVLYGVGPVALVVYLLGRPARRRAREAREQAEREAASAQPDSSGETPARAVPTVRKEP